MRADEPKTLQEAIVYFSDPDNCLDFLVERRWPKGPVCPTCGRTDVTIVPGRRVWQCKTRHPKCQFSIKVGTIFEDSPIGLDKWLTAMWMVANRRNGISSWEMHRSLGVTQKSAWFMLHRLRLAMQDDLGGGLLGGEVEVDETFIGGKARNMHRDKKVKMQKGGRNLGNKSVVMGILERKTEKNTSRVRASVIQRRSADLMKIEVLSNVEKGSQIHSDEAGHFWRMDDHYVHNIINHLETYADGNVHTNTVENFWALLKRGLGGTYVFGRAFHFFRYVDEQAFRYNNRKQFDGTVVANSERFSRLCRKIVGKRLTYGQLTDEAGKKQVDEGF